MYKLLHLALPLLVIVQILIFVYVVTQTQGRLLSSNVRGYNELSRVAQICAAEASDGVLIRHEECDKFYQCSGGFPAVLKCPANLVFNPNTAYCDYPDNVECVSEEKIPEAILEVSTPKQDQQTSSNNDPSLAPEICASEGSDGILVAHEQCNKFYKCSEGVPVALDCPVNLLYNPEKEYCDWPANVDCGNRT